VGTVVTSVTSSEINFAGIGNAPWEDLDHDGEITGDAEKWANKDESTGLSLIDTDIALEHMK